MLFFCVSSITSILIFQSIHINMGAYQKCRNLTYPEPLLPTGRRGIIGLLTLGKGISYRESWKGKQGKNLVNNLCHPEQPVLAYFLSLVTQVDYEFQLKGCYVTHLFVVGSKLLQENSQYRL
ncbi:hypothetical protein NUACC26_089420 [Scytonema sp. NUACC26]